MVAVALASVIVAVISLVGAVGAAAVAAYTAYWSDRRKRHTEATTILNKYRDPLLLSAVALRHKIARLFLHPEGRKARGHKESSRNRRYEKGPEEGGFYKRVGSREESSNDVNKYTITHTAFLVGQFFAWVYIIRMESQFLNIQRTHKTSLLVDAFF